MTLSSHQRGYRGATDVWLTPPDIIHAVGPFDLDPCAAPEPRPWSTAASHITLPHDGLAAEWDGFVWCNPPFGPEAGKWLQRMSEYRNGIALVPARTETRWFVSGVWEGADAVLFLHGRPHFHRPDGERAAANSGAPICLVAYGSTAVQRLANCGLKGTLVPLTTPDSRPLPEVKANGWLTFSLKERSTERSYASALCDSLPADLSAAEVLVHCEDCTVASASFLDQLVKGILVERKAVRLTFTSANERSRSFILTAAERRGCSRQVRLLG